MLNSLLLPPRSISKLSKLSKQSITPRNMITLHDLNFDLSVIDAWSVNGINLNSADTASGFFAASLFPYLALLFFLSKPETKIPKISFYGFVFLLVFVFATIPAGKEYPLH